MRTRLTVPAHAQPRWRREPFRALFGLGVALGAVGVSHWLLVALGHAGVAGPGPFHAVALVQGFLGCLAAGFLLTFVPRRTGTLGPSRPLLGAMLVLPVGGVVCTALGAWRAGQVLFAVALLGVLVFVRRRVRAAGVGRGMPAPFLWVPVALVCGLGGALLMLLPPDAWPSLHAAGVALVLQGLFTGLVAGVGGVLLPVFLHGTPLPSERTAREGKALHAGLALLFLASFALAAAPALADAVRAAVLVGALVVPLRLWRPPARAGGHRRLIWVGAWMVPAGHLLAAAWPAQRVAMLHVAFVGGFAVMALAVSLHVVFTHEGRGDLLARSPPEVKAMGALLALAVAARVLVGVQPGLVRVWLGLGAAAFLSALGVWARAVWRAVNETPVRLGH